MKTPVNPPLAGLGATVVLYILLRLIGFSGISVDMICLGIGLLTFGLLQNMRAGTSLPRASDAERDAVLSTPPSAGSARVVIYRSAALVPESYLVSKMPFAITLDGAKVPPVVNPGFIALEVAPGQHTLVAGIGPKRGETVLLAESGEVLFFQLTTPGSSANGKAALTRNPDHAAIRQMLSSFPMIVNTPHP